MAQFLTPAFLQAFDASGNPYSGGKLYIYAAGTTALLALYSDRNLSAALPNPLVADSAGIFPTAYIAETTFKAVLQNASGVIIKSVDPVYGTGQADNVSADNVSFDGADLGFSAENVQEAIEELDGTFAQLTGADFTGTVSIVSTDDGAEAGPSFELYRNSASPAAADVVGNVSFYGEDSAGNKELYAAMRAVLLDPTSASEDVDMVIRTVVAGTLADRLHVRAGAYMDGATGGDKGVGTFNATAVYANGARVGGAPDAVLEDQKTAATAGGTFTSGAWRTRDLNTEVRDAGGLITLSSNEFTPSVDGWVEWAAPATVVQTHKSRLYNVTDATVAGVGSAAFTDNNEGSESLSVGGCAVTAGKAYRVEHQCTQSNSTNGFGAAGGFSTIEVYTRVKFWRTA